MLIKFSFITDHEYADILDELKSLCVPVERYLSITFTGYLQGKKQSYLNMWLDHIDDQDHDILRRYYGYDDNDLIELYHFLDQKMYLAFSELEPLLSVIGRNIPTTIVGWGRDYIVAKAG